MLLKGSDVAPFCIKLFIKVCTWILLFFVFLNIFLFIISYVRIGAVAKLVQDSVKIHGFLPESDRKAIQNYIDDMMKNTKKRAKDQLAADPVSSDDATDAVIPGINRVVTHLNIAVWDETGRGAQILDSFDSDDYDPTDTSHEDAENYYIGKKGMLHKRQQGDLLYAGVVFRYNFIVPIPFYEGVSITYNGGADFNRTGEFFNGIDDGGEYIENMTEREEWSFISGKSKHTNITDGTTGSSGTYYNLFGIRPVICEEYYPDLPQTNTRWSVIS